MVDIHCHLLPDVDDGAADLDEAVAMIVEGVDDGIQKAVLTPHVLSELNAQVDLLYRQKFGELCERLDKEKIRLELVLGSEIMYQFGLAAVKEYSIGTFNGNGRYCLIELPLNTYPPHFEESLFRLQLSGLVPIVAHPERNGILMRALEKVAAMVHRGILFQVNSESLTGELGPEVQKSAHRMLTQRLVQFVGSDAHSLISRRFALSEARNIATDLVGPDEVHNLFYANPTKAIEGARIEIDMPDLEKPPGLLDRLWGKFLGRRG